MINRRCSSSSCVRNSAERKSCGLGLPGWSVWYSRCVRLRNRRPRAGETISHSFTVGRCGAGGGVTETGLRDRLLVYLEAPSLSAPQCLECGPARVWPDNKDHLHSALFGG